MSRVLGMMKNVGNWPAYLLHKWGVSKQHPFIIKAANGVTLEAPDRMLQTAKEVFFAEDYRFDAMQPDILLQTDAPIVIDVGANVGYLSGFVFTRFPKAKVVSVEPMPKNLELLKRNRDRNPSFDWQLYEGVVSDSDTQVEIQFDDSDSFTTSASLVGLDKGPNSIKVNSLSLASLMSQFSIDVIHVLKLDCEGSEYDILYSLDDEQLKVIMFVTMETHEVDKDDKNMEAVIDWLKAKGFVVSIKHSRVLAKNRAFHGN